MNGRIDFLMRQISPDKCGQPYWHSRIWSELKFLSDISDAENDRFDSLLLPAVEKAYDLFCNQGYISKENCLELEKDLAPAQKDCKEYTLICVGHAHIDMNWMWAFDETVNVTLNTFRTMLKLMDEFPDFTFAQSQASCYKIVEEYGEEELLEGIKKRVKEGRWEVSASTWVEADKNMPSLDSMAKHLLYTKKYLSALLDIPEESMVTDFEPDTFGHSLNLPEILSKGGVKYYYHHRGADYKESFTRWKAPSGESIYAYSDVVVYNSVVDFNTLSGLPTLCKHTGQKTMLRLIGVGDHGGGPSRRDINRLHDRKDWPIFPKIKFGTLREFFETVVKNATNIAVIDSDERNAVFTGCYTTQTRIKRANRISERTLGEAEKFAAFSAIENGLKYPSQKFQLAWERTLFSQFHDILTGSGVNSTREYALGRFQETMALGNTQRMVALRKIGSSINTAGLIPSQDITEDTALGAGVGYGVQQEWKGPDLFRSNYLSAEGCATVGGVDRLFTVFNSATFERTEPVELTVWDWSQNDVSALCFTLPDGTVLPHQVISHGVHHYWSHSYVTVLVEVKVPAMGYTVIKLSRDGCDKGQRADNHNPLFGRVHKPFDNVLENDLVKITLDEVTGQVVSYYDKELNKEYCDPQRKGGIFRYITEDIDKGMSSWIVGRYKNVRELKENVRIRRLPSGDLRQAVQLEIPITDISSMRATLSLEKGSKALNYACEVDWHEIGKMTPEKGFYQLNFSFPLAYECDKYLYQIPGGGIIRDAQELDLPSIGYVCALKGKPEEGGMMITTDSKYGFRGSDNRLSVTLLRSSAEPDPYPENGIFDFRITLSPEEKFCNKCMTNRNYAINNPMVAIDQAVHSGSLPAEYSFMQISECSAVVDSVKADEKTGKKLIVRLNELAGKEKECVLTFGKEVKDACLVNIYEGKIDGEVKAEGKSVKVTPAPFSVTTLEITF